MTDLDAELSAALAEPALDGARALLDLVARSDRVHLEALLPRLQERVETTEAEELVASLQMAIGAALARRASENGAAASGDIDQVLGALNALAAEPASADRAARFAPLGAHLLENEVPAFVDMRVTTAEDETVFLWTSGVMALRRATTDRR